MGYAYFGVHYYAECYTAPDAYAAANYARRGKSTSCWSGVGSSTDTFFYTFNQVSLLIKRELEDLIWLKLCWNNL